MITELFAIVGDDGRPALRRYLARTIAFCLLQGSAFLFILPLMNAVFSADFQALWAWLTPFAVIAIIAIVLNYLASVQGVELTFAITRRLYDRIGDHITSLPLGWFTAGRIGTVTRTITHSSQNVTLVFGFLLVPFVNGIIAPAVITVGLLFIDWRVGLAFVIAIPFLWGAKKLGTLFSRRGDGGIDRAAARANARVIEYAQAQKVLRAHGAVGDANSTLQEALLAQRRASATNLITTIPGSVIFRTAVQLVLLLAVVVIVPLALGAQITPATGIGLIAVAAQFTASIGTLSDLSAGIGLARSSLRKIDDILRERPLPVVRPRAIPSAHSDLRLENVTFGYTPSRPVLHNISFSVPPGTTTAIVGPSGAGKSTVMKLAARFFDPDSGTVSIAGHDIRRYDAQDLTTQFALVSQDVYLFDDTVWENIRIGRPNASDDDVIEAARIARVTDIVDRLPEGWATRAGEGGHSLSGGERQRVAIARAILKNAPLLLLDEVTSALDPVNEAAFLDALAHATRNTTVLVIAHRLSTIRSAEQILFVEDGRIVEQGSHEELLTANNAYAKFWNQRADATTWSITSTQENQ